MDTISGITEHRAYDSPEPLGSMMKFLSSWFYFSKQNLFCKEKFFIKYMTLDISTNF